MTWELAAAASAASLLGGERQNKANKAASAKQMEFQERMSNTSYQRGMADMRASGLNPILAGKMGGASSPGGATYQAQNIGTQAAQSAANVMLTEAQTAKIKAETNNLQETEGSFLGRTFTFIKQEAKALFNGFKNMSNNQKVSKVVDKLVKDNKDLYVNSGKSLTQFKEELNRLVREATTNSKKRKHVVTKQGIKPLLTKPEARKYVNPDYIIGEIN